MRNRSVWQHALGLARTVVEGIDLDGGDAVVITVRPAAKAANRCGRCGHKAPRYDHGEGRRRWRAMDLGRTKVFVEADAPRVTCRDHGVTVAQVPWARHDARHTRDFDDFAAWLAVHTSRSAVNSLLRIAWVTVGAIVARVSADIDAAVDRLEGLTRIGIDEVSYKKGRRYITVVVDHDTGRLVWAAAGREIATLHHFFDLLGPERAALLTHVTADMAPWIAQVVAKRAPQAAQCADPFHIVAWAQEALDMERRRAWNQARGRKVSRHNQFHRPTSTGPARSLQRARFALWKNPEDLTEPQRHQLQWIATTDPALYEAYLLKEAMRYVFAVKGEEAKIALDCWIDRALESELPSFVELAGRILTHRAAIDATLDHGLSNALAESTNTKIRLLTRIAYGFHSPEPLIALAMLALGGHAPSLPGRA